MYPQRLAESVNHWGMLAIVRGVRMGERHQMKNRHLASLVAATLLASPAAASAAEIVVATSLAPNVFGSPSYAGYVSNALAGLHAGASSYGDPNSPTFYQVTSDVRSDQVIVTGFPSWMGEVDPGTNVGGAYASELGNRMHFGVRIDGQGSQFSISQLGFSATSTDPFNALAFGFGPGAFNYTNDYRGVLVGDDGLLWTTDDVFITGGANTQLVDGLIGRGPGNSFAAYCAGCTLEQQQAALLESAAYPGHDFQFTGVYTLGQDSGSGTFNITAVPEPSTWTMLIAGFGLLGAALRRRRLAVA